MIREIIRAKNDKLVINIPKEYIGKDLEVLVFSNNEILKPKQNDNNKNELLEEFERLTKKTVKIDPEINIVKLDEDMYDDLF